MSNSPFKTGSTFYPELVENVRDRSLLDHYRAEVDKTLDALLTIDLAGAAGKAFRGKYASEIDAFATKPHTELSADGYAQALHTMAELREVSRAGASSSSAASAVPLKAKKPLANVTQAQLSTWMSGSDGKINPDLLKYIRDTADHFESIEISATSYTSSRSMSLSHRKMMTYLIQEAGDVNIAVRWVDEKIVSTGNAAITAAVIAIPRSKIELILCEHGMATREGAFCEFLWAVYNAGCVYRKGLEDSAPDFIGGGSKAELAKGVSISPEMRTARRVAFAKSNCNYLRSLFTSPLFIGILDQKVRGVGSG